VKKTTLTFVNCGTDVAPPTTTLFDCMVFDVAHGKMEAGNVVNMLQRLGGPETKEKGNNSRLFTINDDGTVSPTAAPHLLLGVDFVP